jgi:uncharacterized membrane protein
MIMARHLVRSFFRQFRTNIITGFFLLIPVAASLFIFWKLFTWADEALPGMLGVDWPPFVGLVVSILVVYFVGLLAKNYFGKKIIAMGNAIIVSIPLLNKIYLGIKQVIDTVSIDKKKLFSRVVLTEFPRAGSYAVGLVTSESNDFFSTKAGKNLVAVFIPTVPNPTSGFLIYLPAESLVTIDIPVENALKLLLSLGLLGTEKLTGQEKPASMNGRWKWTDIFTRKSGKKVSGDTTDPRD